MLRELLESGDLLSLPVLGMLLFMTIFGAVIVWVFARKRQDHFRRMASLPLQDELEPASREEDLR